jgi:hypothetical protein
MSERLDEDLARWEAGELSLRELEDRYPEGYVRELLSLHDRLVDLTVEETPDPEPGWVAMRPRLRPRRIPNRWIRIGRRAHRPAMVAAAAVLLAGGLAFAAEPVRQVMARVFRDVVQLIGDGEASSSFAASVKDISVRGREDTKMAWTPPVKNVDEALTCSALTSPAHGIVTVVSDCSRGSYIPDPDFYGIDSFSYAVADSTGERIAAKVSIVVEPVNDAPVAEDDDATTQEDTAVTIGVLGNDSDVDGDSLTVQSATGATNGSVTVDDRSVIYIPHPDFQGTDTFTYAVADSTSQPTTAAVSITVDPVNDAPVADDASISGEEETTIPWIPSVGDVDGDVLTCSIITPPAHGSVTLNPDCSGGSYTPEADYSGTDTIVYEVSDRLVADAATITVEVGPANDAPVANDVAVSGPEDTTIPWAPSVGDIDGDVLTCSITTTPAHGGVTVNPDCSGGSYTPDPNYNGPDSNAYGVTDGGAIDTATVTVEVSPVNDPAPPPP